MNRENSVITGVFAIEFFLHSNISFKGNIFLKKVFNYIRNKVTTKGDVKMAPLAGPNITLLMLTAMEHDLTFRINQKMDVRMRLCMNSIFLANSKSTLYQQSASTNNNSQRASEIEAAINSLASQEKIIASYEKTLEMEITQLQNQLKVVQQRKEGAQKMVDQGAKSFNYGN